MTARPAFALPEYRRHVIASLEAGREPFPPERRDEYLVLEEIWPSMARRMRPEPKCAEHIGLPRDYGVGADQVQPFDRLFRRRLLKTIEADPEFAEALAGALEAAR